MTGMYSVQIVSGLAVQQQYRSTALSGDTSPAQRTQRTTRLSEDTVDISPQAYELFRTQGTPAATGWESEAESRRTDTETGTKTESASNGNTVQDRVEEVETEISSLEAEIATLENEARTNEIATALLRSKKARLRILEAMLTGLNAKSMLPA